MEFKTASQCAKDWCIFQRRVQVLCIEGRINGAFKIGDFWAIPSDAQKPRDKRRKNSETKEI